MVTRLLFRRRKLAEVMLPSAPVSSQPQDTAAGDLPAEDHEERRKVDRWWRGSSFELRHGLEVCEVDTVPAEMFDELFRDNPWERRRRGSR